MAIQAMKYAVSQSACSRVHNPLKACLLSALTGSALLLSGCDHKAPPVASAPPSTDSVPATTAAANATPAASQPVAPQPIYTPPATPAPTIAAATTGGADLKQLNHYYIGWIVQNRRRVSTFEEFVSLSGVQVPPAPAGKKYVIDRGGFINLADR